MPASFPPPLRIANDKSSGVPAAAKKIAKKVGCKLHYFTGEPPHFSPATKTVTNSRMKRPMPKKLSPP